MKRTFKELSSVNLAGCDLESDNMALREHIVSQAIHDITRQTTCANLLRNARRNAEAPS